VSVSLYKIVVAEFIVMWTYIVEMCMRGLMMAVKTL